MCTIDAQDLIANMDFVKESGAVWNAVAAEDISILYGC